MEELLVTQGWALLTDLNIQDTISNSCMLASLPFSSHFFRARLECREVTKKGITGEFVKFLNGMCPCFELGMKSFVEGIHVSPPIFSGGPPGS
jgi:hypothetical protein